MLVFIAKLTAPPQFGAMAAGRQHCKSHLNVGSTWRVAVASATATQHSLTEEACAANQPLGKAVKLEGVGNVVQDKRDDKDFNGVYEPSLTRRIGGRRVGEGMFSVFFVSFISPRLIDKVLMSCRRTYLARTEGLSEGY